MYWTDKSAYTTSVSLQTSFRTGDVRRPGTITLPMPEFSGDRNYQRHHTCAHSHMHCRPICWRSVWERCCAHSLAQWDVATPAPNWSLSPLSRLHSLICICHICRKERHSGESTMSQKKRASDINSLPCGFCMTMIICLFAWTPWPSGCSSRMQRMHHVKRRYLHSYTVKHLIADRACACRPAQVYICAVLPIRKHTRSRLSSFHHGHHHNFR